MKNKFTQLTILIILIFIIFIIFYKFNFFKRQESEKTPKEDIHKIVIIGSGPAGLSAAIYASRAKLNPIIVQGEYAGGQLNKASYLENWPGTISILGPDLAKNLKDQALQLGTKFIPSTAVKVDFSQHPFIIHTNDNQKLLAESIVIATGTKPTKLNCPGEEQYLGKGLAICATCDAPLFKNKDVVVIGGNFSALREIDILSKYTDKITVVNRKSELTGPLSWLLKVKENPKIKIMNNCIAQEIHGDGTWVSEVQIFNKNKNKQEVIPAEGVFVSVGWEPSTDIFENQISLDGKKQIKVHNNTQTSVEGIFAAGDVTNNSYHQAPVAAAFGYMAGMDAEKYLTK